MGVRIGGAVSYPLTNPDDSEQSVTAKAGDTLSTIASRYNVPVQSLLDANPQLQDPSAIIAGREIKLPSGDPANAAPSSGGAVADTTPSGPRAGSIQDMDKMAAIMKMNQQLAQELGRKAGMAGLDDADVRKLTNFLSNLPPQDFKRQANLFEDALHSGDRVRAMRTFLDVAPLAQAHPDRITPDIEQSLVMGVGTSRIDNLKGDLKGMAGVMGEDNARRAAEALANMPEDAYKKIAGALSQAGTGAGPDGSAETERALILKAVGARLDTIAPKAGQKADLVANSTWEVLHFADDIRGTPRNELIEKSTVQDLLSPQGGNALQQRFSTSCVPTSAQITAAESDPTVAWRMHREAIHSTSTTGNIADDQEFLLKLNGGVAVPRDKDGGVGMNGGRGLNQLASQTTHRVYTEQNVGDSKQARTDALDQAEALLHQNIAVPIGVEWGSGGGHAEVITDVRGDKPDRTFWITDPFSGTTRSLQESQIENGNTDFMAGRGRLSQIYPSVPQTPGN